MYSSLCAYYSDVTWGSWHLISLASWLFVQHLATKKTWKLHITTLPLWGESTNWFLSQKASDMENISIIFQIMYEPLSEPVPLCCWILGNKFQWSLHNKKWFKKMHLKMSSATWRPLCLDLNVLMMTVNIVSGSEQAITWANVYPDMWHHMVSLGHYDLMGYTVYMKPSWHANAFCITGPLCGESNSP